MVFPGVGNVSQVIGPFVLLLGMISLFSRRQLTLRRPSLFLSVMALFVLWSSASYFWSIDPSATLNRSLTFAQLFAMTWLIWQLCQTRKEQLAIMQAYVVGALMATSSALSNFAAGNAQGSYNRFSATGFDPNDFATILALGIPMAWFLVVFGRQRFLYWVNLLYVPWAIFVIVLTGSRGGLLVTAIALSIIPLTYINLTLWRKLGFLALLTAGTYLLFSLGGDLQSRLVPSLKRLSTTITELTEGDLDNRTTIWAAGLEVIGQSPHPWAGFGSGTFRYAVEPLLGSGRAPHNAYLSVLVDMGLVGLTLFLSLFVIASLPVLRSPEWPFYLILLFTLLIALIPLGWETKKSTWFVLSLLTAQKAYVLDSAKGSLVRAVGAADTDMSSSRLPASCKAPRKSLRSRLKRSGVAR